MLKACTRLFYEKFSRNKQNKKRKTEYELSVQFKIPANERSDGATASFT